MGLVISNSTLSDLTSLTSVFPIYKSTKPPTAARVKETYNKRLNYYQDQHSPLQQHTPQGYLQRPSPRQLFLCPGLQAAVSPSLVPRHHHRKRWEELQGSGKLLSPLLSLSSFPDPSTAHRWHFLPTSLGACKANSHLVLLARLPNPEHQIFPALSQYPAKKLFSLNASWGSPIEPHQSAITSCAFRTCTHLPTRTRFN